MSMQEVTVLSHRAVKLKGREHEDGKEACCRGPGEPRGKLRINAIMIKCLHE